MIRNRLIIIGMIMFGVPVIASADKAVVDCTDVPNSSHSKLITGVAAYRFAADILKNEGAGDFRKDDEKVQSTCIIDSFEMGAAHVRIAYAGPIQSEQRILYQVNVSGETQREFLVLYTGVFNLMSNIHLAFSIVESQTNKLDIYQIYHKEPPYNQVRTFIEKILSTNASPVVSAVWPNANDEPNITLISD